MTSRHSFVSSLPLTAILAVNISLSAFGLMLLVLPGTIRNDIASFQSRHFPIYPEGRPTSGSSKAPYFPVHLNTQDNSAQLALGGAAALYGCISSALLYVQWSRPTEFCKPMHRIAGFVAMIAAGSITAFVACIATGLSFEASREGRSIDLNSVGYWPWQKMFPTINWSVEGWTCKVYEQLNLPSGTEAATDFEHMCAYSRLSKWLSLILLFLGIIAVVMGCAALAEHRCLEQHEKNDLWIESLRDSEKRDKRLV